MIIKIKTFSGESLYIPEEDYLDEVMYSGERKLMKEFLANPNIARDPYSRKLIKVSGHATGVVNNVLSPIRRTGVKVKGLLKGKSKRQIQRDLGALDAREARQTLAAAGSEGKGHPSFPEKITEIRDNVSGLNKATKRNRPYNKEAAKKYRRRLKKNHNDSLLDYTRHAEMERIAEDAARQGYKVPHAVELV